MRTYTFRHRSAGAKAKAAAYSRAGVRAKAIDRLLKDAPPLRNADIERWRAQLGAHPRVDDLVFDEEDG